jgi:hypothetical protein
LRAVPSSDTKKAPAKKTTKKKTTPRATPVQMRARAAQLVTLVASGDTITEAATKLKMQRTAANELYNKELARMIDEAGARESLVTTTLETLRLLKQAHMPLALKGDEKSSRIILGITSQESDLLGLKAAIQVQVSNQRIDNTVTDVVKLIESAEASLPRLLESDVFIIDQRPDDNESAG